jgi:hypothetical protein
MRGVCGDAAVLATARRRARERVGAAGLVMGVVLVSLLLARGMRDAAGS